MPLVEEGKSVPLPIFVTVRRPLVKARRVRTGAGYVSHREGDYARAQAAGVECVPLLVETFGGMSPALYDALREASDWRANKLTSSEYDETTWSARTWMTFVAQRISVAVQLSSAQEVAEALGLVSKYRVLRL